MCFRSEKIQNLMREGGEKKHLRKKTLNLFLEKFIRATIRNKKNIGQISRKVNEGDEIKNFLKISYSGRRKRSKKTFF